MRKREQEDVNNAHDMNEVCRLLRCGRFSEIAHVITGTGSLKKSEESEIDALLQSALFWKGKMDAAAALEQYAASEFLITAWGEFSSGASARALARRPYYALKEFIYKKALAGYRELYNLSGIADADLLARMGALYQGLGDYERAIQSYELAHAQTKNDPRVIAALADCYAMVEETRAAKLFFREAFFLDAEASAGEEREAPFLKEIARRLEEEGIPEGERAYWLPVYGAILGVFNVKRELKPVEIGRLTQSIRELEEAYAGAPSGRLKALLLNKYFWLADHYAGIKAPREELDEVLRNIRRLDEAVYRRFVN